MTPDPSPDPVTALSAELDRIGERYARLRANPLYQGALLAETADDEDGSTRLLTAVRTALEKAGEWETEAKRIDGIFAADEDPWPRTVGGMRAQAFEECARTLREAITRELTGKGGGS